MEVLPVPDLQRNFKERTVSNLAMFFESKIEDRLVSSPRLQPYPKFAFRNKENEILSCRKSAEKDERLNKLQDVSRKLTKHHIAASTTPSVYESLADYNTDGSLHNTDAKGSGCCKIKISSGGARQQSHSLNISRPNLCKVLATPPPGIKSVVSSTEQRSAQSGSVDEISGNYVSTELQKTPLEVKSLQRTNQKANIFKPRRAGSFSSGVQRSMGPDKRTGLLDERNTQESSELNLQDEQFERRTTELSSLHRDKSFDIWNDFENDATSCYLTAGKATSNSFKCFHKERRTRKYIFRALSLSNVCDAERSEELDSVFCYDCGGRRAGHQTNLSFEDCEKVKDERDHLRYERDRAMEEWTVVASKWNVMLDEMDELLEQLNQAKKERDEKEFEISEIVEKYEEEINLRADDFNQLKEDYAEMDAQLTVAKKERVDALTEYENLLKRHYDVQQEVDIVEDENAELQGRIATYEQRINSLVQQLENTQQERDHALQLWNTSARERKKLHHEMETLLQSRDASLRKTFQQAEELNKMREDRDALQRELNCGRAKGSVDPLQQRNHTNGCNDRNENGTPQRSGSYKSLDENRDEPEVEFHEFAVSLERFQLDSKYGIKVETAVDEPNAMIVNVGAHVSSKNDIRVYDRILSVNGVSVYRADKKTVEKLLRDCPGRLTMVLRRQNFSRQLQERIQNVDITLPKPGGQHSKRGQGLGMKLKVEIVGVDGSSSASGVKDIDPGDVIMNVNTQDVSKLFESILYKLAKKSNGNISLRVRKPADLSSYNYKAQQPHLLSPSTRTRTTTQSLSDVSESSSPSLVSFTSEEAALTAFTDDNGSVSNGSGSIFNGSGSVFNGSGSLNNGNATSPNLNIVYENRYEDDISSLPERLRKISNTFQETDRTVDNLSNGFHQNGVCKNGHPPIDEIPVSDCPASPCNDHVPRRHCSETRSLRSLKNTYSPRGAKQSLRRARSDAIDRKVADKPFENNEQDKLADNASISNKSLLETPEETNRNSWVMPSPELPRKKNRNENNAINIFATLPRPKKKSVIAADCNKSTSHRVLRLEKLAHEPLGFDICGGNKVGIFVKEIQEGSMASFGGVKVGDRLLYMNSFDLSGATLDFATRIVLRSEHLTSFRIEVKFEEKFKDLMKELPRDSLYVRAVRACGPNDDSELKFGVGEILHVTNTLAYRSKTVWKWYGEKVSRKAAGEAGLIPRLEGFIQDERENVPELDNNQDKSTATINQKKRRRPSATDVKNWLLRKPSTNKNKREREKRSSIIENENRNRYYEILMDK